MSRNAGVLAVLAWLAGGIAWGQGTPTTPPASDFAIESEALLPPAPIIPVQAPVTGRHPADPSDRAKAAAPPITSPADPAKKAAATLEELGKSVETLSKNLTVVTGVED